MDYPHPHHPYSAAFPISPTDTLPPALLQALHRLATFSSDIQLLTSHFAPHLHFNTFHPPFSKPTPRTLARRRKPTLRSTAWRLQNSLPPDPRSQLPNAKTTPLSFVTTPFSSLPARPVSAPPLSPKPHISEVLRSSSIPRATQSCLQVTTRKAHSANLKTQPDKQSDTFVHHVSTALLTPTSRADCVTPDPPPASNSRTNTAVIVAPVVDGSASTATVGLGPSSDVNPTARVALNSNPTADDQEVLEAIGPILYTPKSLIKALDDLDPPLITAVATAPVAAVGPPSAEMNLIPNTITKPMPTLLGVDRAPVLPPDHLILPDVKTEISLANSIPNIISKPTSASVITDTTSSTAIEPILKTENPLITTFNSNGLTPITTIDSPSNLASTSDQETVAIVGSDPAVFIDSVLVCETIDSISTNTVNPVVIVPALDKALLEPRSTKATDPPSAIVFDSTHITADLKPCTGIDLIPNTPNSHINNSADSSSDQETVVNVHSKPTVIIDSVIDFECTDSNPIIIIEPALIVSAVDQAVLESESTSPANSPSDIDSDSKHTIADLEPGTTIDLISNALNPCVDTSSIVNLDPTSTVDLIGVISNVNPLVSNSTDVPITPSTSSVASSNNVNSSTINKNKKKKKKRKKSKTSNLTTPSPHPLNSELTPTSNFVLSSEEGWIEFDPVSGNRVEPFVDQSPSPLVASFNESINRSIHSEHETRCAVHQQSHLLNVLIERHPGYILLRVDEDGILLGVDSNKSIPDQDVIFYHLDGTFGFERRGEELFW